MTILACTGLKKNFGGLTAIDNVDFSIRTGEILGLIGPNGAGKTTLVSLLCGEITPTAGKISLEGKDVTTMPSHRRAELGLARTFQIPRPFNTMTLHDNILVAAAFGSAQRRRDPASARQKVAETLHLVGLQAMANQYPSTLSTAGLKRLEVARSLAAGARLVFLDEPLGGLNQTETQEAIRLIRMLPEKGVTVVLIEHVIKAVVAVSDRVLVLAGGRKLAEGTPAEIIANETVKRAYLGDIEGAIARSRMRRNKLAVPSGASS